MNISLSWIKDFVDLPNVDIDDLSKKFTLATCEVEKVEKINSVLKNIIIAKILEIEKHPNSDKLNLVLIDKGNSKTQKVVCGAPNVKVGIKVPFAPLGTQFSPGFTITPRDIKGVISEGMLCSEVELSVGDDDSGLLVFPDNAPVGTTVAEFLNKNEDIIFDIDNKSITHRPDLWAIYGMAREFAAIYGVTLKTPYDKEWEKNLEKNWTIDKNYISVSVDKNSACKGYFGLCLDNIVIKESPSYIKERLLSSGMRPINNIVDISNYVMLELGMPNHIFDTEKIESKKIIIKRAGKNFNFITLDEVERKMDSEDTLIFDQDKPIAIAGIMGGLSSGISNNTKSVFIEVANFIDSEIRKTSTRLGLRTDSSQRFEKNLDSQLLKRTALRIFQLIKEQCPEVKVCGNLVYSGENLADYKNLVINISCNKIRDVLGVAVDDTSIVSILERLDFKVKNSSGELTIDVPSYRATKDIECDADIIEEIGRMVGYDNIIPKSPLSIIEPIRLPLQIKFERKVKDFLVLNGRFLEIFTYPMIGKKLLEKARWDNDGEKLRLVNAINPDTDRMRPSLIPSALQIASNNCKNFSNFRFFELGRAYLEDDKNFSVEKTHLIIGAFDKSESKFLELINIVENLLSYLNLPSKVEFSGSNSTLFPKNWEGVHPYENLDIKILGKNSGTIFSVNPTLNSSFKIKGNLSFAVLDFSDVANVEMKDKTKYMPLPKFPTSIFDCSVVSKKDEPVINILNAVKSLKVKEMVDLKIVGTFKLDEENKSVTLRATFLDREKTLSGEFLDSAKNSIVDALAKAGFPLKN